MVALSIHMVALSIHMVALGIHMVALSFHKYPMVPAAQPVLLAPVLQPQPRGGLTRTYVGLTYIGPLGTVYCLPAPTCP
eukprot:9019324-Pyramimonas_sp.AAC.1